MSAYPEDIASRYSGMAAYDLPRYFGLLEVMRRYDRETSEGRGGFRELRVQLAYGVGLAVALALGWLNLHALGIVYGLPVVALFLWHLSRLVHARQEFEEGFVKAAMSSGYTRADATEFLHDIDWDDVQCDDNHLNYIREDLNRVEDL